VPNNQEELPVPISAGQVLPTAIMVFIAMVGGALSFWQKIRTGRSRAFNLAEFIGEIFISGFSGLMAWWVFQGLGVNQYLTAAGVGIAGHMGSRAIFLGEQFLEAWLERWKVKK
jgi:NhaP-type Na+/H+ and K+/H+ antiporter